MYSMCTQKPRETKCACLHTVHNRKNFKSDLQNHSWTESHRMSKAKMDALSPNTCNCHQKLLCTTGKEIVENNKRFLTSVVKCLEFCGRQGLVLRDHRGSTAPDKKQQGDFKGLFDFHVDVGDQLLQEHLEMCSKKASYISRTTQNELLEYIRQYDQDHIIDEIRHNQLFQNSFSKLMK